VKRWKYGRSSLATLPPGPLSAYALEHHERWGVADSLIALRRTEDQAACAAVGAAARYYDLPDCIYRRLPNGEAP
jgi:hypothetical protein